MDNVRQANIAQAEKFANFLEMVDEVTDFRIKGSFYVPIRREIPLPVR